MTPTAEDSPRREGPAEGDAPKSRRSFLQASALVAGPALLAATAAGTARAAGTTTGIQIPNLYPGWNARNFSEIRSDENAHVAFLKSALGSNALPAPQLNTAALTISTANPIFFAAYASVFENTGAATYLNAAPLIYNPQYLAAAGSIYAVECCHSGYLNTLVDFPLTPNSATILQPFTVQETLLNISAYLVNPAPVVQLANSISTTPSAANDILILNFALVLELLEQEFYNINVPVFFGV